VAKITLDADTFRALASSTRLTVLKALDERRKTLTELARDLQLNKATVHEHMQLLTGAGLVRKRDDEGRKWIYYELTWTGQRILHPEATTTFNLLLGLSVAAAGGGVAMLGRALGWWFAAHHPQPASEGFGGDNRAVPMAADQAASASGTETGSSAGSATSASSASSAPAPAAAGSPADHTRGAEQTVSGGGTGAHHSYFFTDGGWMAIALAVTCLVFLLVAWGLRRKLRAKPFDPKAAAVAEGIPPGM